MLLLKCEQKLYAELRNHTNDLIKHGIFQARILEWVAISFSRGSSWPRDRTQVSHIVSKTLYRPSHQGSQLNIQFSSVQSLSRVWHFVTPWIAARQASLSITNSRSSPKLMSIESVMPSSHLILCRPLLLLPPILLSIRIFSNESTLRMRWPKYWSFSFSISPSKEHPGPISFRMDWLDLLAKHEYIQKQSRKRKISPFECIVPKNTKER